MSKWTRRSCLDEPAWLEFLFPTECLPHANCRADGEQNVGGQWS
ncbi:hypothetical protein [Lysobacter gummosus]